MSFFLQKASNPGSDSQMAETRQPPLETGGNAPRRGLLGRFGRTSCGYCKKTIRRTTRQKRYCSSTCRFRDWKNQQRLIEEQSWPRTPSGLTDEIMRPAKLEKMVRSILKNLTRFRLQWHPDRLPGQPQFANRTHRIVVFVYSCFKHGCPRHFRPVKGSARFWRSKAEHIRAQDAYWRRIYHGDGWRVITIWEHSIRRAK